MSTTSEANRNEGWLESSGVLHLFRAPVMAVQPAKLGIALMAIVVTFFFGVTLDFCWSVGGGVSEDTIARYIESRATNQPFVPSEGDHGIFQVWREHERRCVLGLLGSSVPGSSVAAGTTIGTYMESHSTANPLQNLAGLAYGIWWMFDYHPLFFLVFSLGCLAIWSYAGGAICRLAAVQFARDENLTAMTALQYARRQWFGGFFLAPCIPLLIILGITVLLVIFGGVLRFWVLGDILAGLMFWLALLGGFVITLMMVGLFIGGNLFWPSIAVQGSDAFDALSVGLSYPFNKSWKWILYTCLSIVYAGICWVFVNLFTYLMFTVTRSIVAFGTSPFGWWTRGTQENPKSKLEMLWPLGGPNNLYAPPNWSELIWYEYFSACMIGFFVLLVIALMWSFLVSFYFSSSTIMFYLLRRDVDGVDLSEVYLGEEEEDDRFSLQAETSDSNAVVLEEKSQDEASTIGTGATTGEMTLPVMSAVPAPVITTPTPVITTVPAPVITAPTPIAPIRTPAGVDVPGKTVEPQPSSETEGASEKVTKPLSNLLIDQPSELESSTESTSEEAHETAPESSSETDSDDTPRTPPSAYLS